MAACGDISSCYGLIVHFSVLLFFFHSRCYLPAIDYCSSNPIMKHHNMNDANYRSLQKSSTAKVCVHALMHPDTTSAAEFCELCSMEQFANVRH